MRLFGRRRIYTDCTDINESNIEQVLSESLRIHAVNAREIDYLRWYVRGRQPILNREKKVRKDICNKTVMNLAQECLDFKLGYIWGEPVGIVRRAGAAENDGVEQFNSFLDEQSKADIDQDIANDFCIGGLGYRAIFPNMNRAEASPFVMAKLDPETTFCVYQNDAFKHKVLGVSFCVHFDGTVTYSAYTDTKRFELESSALGGGVALKSVSYNGIGIIPIVEYSAPDLSGPAFERALPLLDAINILSSNRLDDVGQFIQSILWIHNAQMDEEDIRKLDELLAVQTQSPGDGQQASLKYLSTPLDQTTVQSLQECLERHVYELSGIPGREQSSGGSTGTAAEMGEAGWKKIEFQAKRLEAAWKRAEREAIAVELAIIDRSSGLDESVRTLKPTDFDIKFIRSKNYNILTKTQGMINMLTAGIHPRIAVRESDLFSDPEQVYQDSKEYLERAVDRLFGDKEVGAVDVTNQPKGEQSLTAAVDGKGTIQKRD